MKRKFFLHIAFIMLLPMASCNLEPLEEDQLPSFDKLYAVSENIEAIDFICKPDASGYIIVGNLTSSDNSNSDIIIIDVGANGIQQNFHRIYTPQHDEAVAIKLNENDNSVFILAHRKSDQSQDIIEQNLILKANLQGVPVRASNASIEDTVSAEIKVLTPENNNQLIRLNDFLITPPNLICVGQIRLSPAGNYSRVTQIFNISSVDFNNSNDSTIIEFRQKPDQKNYSNSELFKITNGNVPSAVYEVIGQNISENPDGDGSEPSQNITWDAYTDLESSAGEPIFIGTDRDEKFGDILYHSNGKNYIAGNYENTDSATLFLITKEYTGFNNNRGQNVYAFSNYGNEVMSLTEDSDGNIIMATKKENEMDNNNTSHLLKFSQSGVPIENQEFEFRGTGLDNVVRKIESEPGNILVILSQKTFDNNSTAIGLMKIKF
ncbi:hypothetical protein SAMN05661096_01062 [Marivirga sericea]|uniref:Uncharacterized protein n=1 Tax=Marivirga sericea TaxID=1028 RepID=A0A1X7IT71_9BACT|nr:hypothetical protein [Marivirga sericea]SMG18357.1 hypothetical protein SAMN05661096_01062 [Marivirga sericea]